jgi:cysteine desulfurase family protein (TIGR01976 family)
MSPRPAYAAPAVVRTEAAPSAFDPHAIRRLFPALAEGIAHFDGPGGTQVPLPVSDAIAVSLRSAVSNLGGAFASSRRADETVAAARRAIADLVGADPDGVILGPSMTALTYIVSSALAKTWGPGDEVVVTRLDHDANVRPWVAAAERAGATVRWLGIDRQTCRLDDIHAVLSDRTRVVAVTAASNAVGTRPDVREIADAAHALGALVYVDGVHLTPHAPVDVAALGADFFAFSAYKICGPHVASVVADPALLATLQPDKLDPAPTTPAGRFERGTAPFELLAGVTATVDFLAGLVPAAGNRRARVLASMTALEGYESALFGRLRAGLEGLERVTTYGAAARRTPTIGVRVDGWTPRQVAEALGARGIAVWDGHFYAVELIRALGLADSGGIVRIGLAHYSTYAEVDRLLGALAGLAATPPGSDTMTHSVGSEPTE